MKLKVLFTFFPLVLPGFTHVLPRQAGTLGGAAPPVENSGDPDRPFSVNGNTFVNEGAAIQRSCDIQHNTCADAANSGADFSVGDCDDQLGTGNNGGQKPSGGQSQDQSSSSAQIVAPSVAPSGAASSIAATATPSRPEPSAGNATSTIAVEIPPLASNSTAELGNTSVADVGAQSVSTVIETPVVIGTQSVEGEAASKATSTVEEQAAETQAVQQDENTAGGAGEEDDIDDDTCEA